MTVYTKARHLGRKCIIVLYIHINLPFAPSTFQGDCPFGFGAIDSFMQVIRVLGIAQIVIFVPKHNACSVTHSRKIDHLVQVDNYVWRFLAAIR